ncbi:MAG: AmmeMemoRadiSam system radical SAM enzyme [Anaerolineae bacterium]|nr:AmmeMemoRadiSam system radical SAM enzyme [Anaerolineae bacterium]MDW8068513.1 AmmeMemoRadiSam system radical SAM enzyme [Anaerolineae bacterium]
MAGHDTSVQPALLQEPVGEPSGRRVRCRTCERRCVLRPGETGWCGTRQNRDGTLVTLIYGIVSSLSANPIEKKPLYHFYPGTVALTSGVWSCNFACPWCQNWEISKRPPDGGDFYSPEAFVAETIRRRCQGTSISFNEPTLSLEWALDVFRLARAAGLYNTFVTNGYMTEEALDLLVEAGLDGMNVDVKGDARTVREYCQASVEVIWRNLRQAQEQGVWVEVTTLVIPGVNDGKDMLAEIAARIAGELGPDTPWHLTRYYPAYRFTAPPTPIETLERAREQGQAAGLRYVYIGNVPGHPAEHTYCPTCGEIVIRRRGIYQVENRLQEGRCPACGTLIPGRW